MVYLHAVELCVLLVVDLQAWEWHLVVLLHVQMLLFLEHFLIFVNDRSDHLRRVCHSVRPISFLGALGSILRIIGMFLFAAITAEKSL